MKVRRNQTDFFFPANLRLLAEADRLQSSFDHAQAPEGLLEAREGTLLYLLARRAALIGDVLEIGSFKGRSTWYLARGLSEGGGGRKVVAIDPHLEGTREDFRANLEQTEIEQFVEVHDAFSNDVELERAIGGLWIDGDHSYASARADFDRWFDQLLPGGWVAFHDTVNHWHGPTRLVRELLIRRDDLRDIGVVGTITYATKAAPSRANRIRSVAARVGFEGVTLLRSARVGFGPRNAAAGEP